MPGARWLRAKYGYLNAMVMKRIIIILWAGSVLCGACSIWRRAERMETTSGKMATHVARAGIRSDTAVARADRLVQVDRQWEVVAPQSGTTYRYTERFRVAEAAQSRSATVAQHAETARYQEQVETAEYRQGESRARGWAGWWLVIAAAAAVWLAVRLFRFWPFK